MENKIAAEIINYELSQFIVNLVMNHTWVFTNTKYTSSLLDQKYSVKYNYHFFIVFVPPAWKQRVFQNIEHCVNGAMLLPHRTILNYPYIRCETANKSTV